MVPVAAAAAQHRPDVAVDRLHDAEGDLLVAVVEDALEMAREQATELLEGRQPLPAQGPQPIGQEPAGGSLVGVGPELGQLLLEEIRLGQPAGEGKELAERLPVPAVQGRPAPQEEPTLAAHQPPRCASLTEALGPPGLVYGLAGRAEDMELVVHEPGMGQGFLQAEAEGLPHVHAHGPDRPPAPGRQRLGEEAVQRLALAPHPERLRRLEVADNSSTSASSRS